MKVGNKIKVKNAHGLSIIMYPNFFKTYKKFSSILY